MTSKDGAGPDDDELDQMMGSMRSMWRDLPDEEPPSRGLDALMAAARTKAVEMQPAKEESWFRRALAMLARPPVLAAATVVVLIGSTVLLTQREGGDRAATPTTRTFDEAAPAKAAAEKSKQVVTSDELGDGAAGSAAPPAAQTVERPSRARPAIVQRPAPVREAKPPVEPAPPPEPMVAPDRELGVTDAEKPATIKQNGERTDAPTTADAVAVESTSGRPPAPAAGRPPTVSSQQLLKQAETAASRNDCPAVRATAERIRKIDDRLYRSRVVTQPAIKRCL